MKTDRYGISGSTLKIIAAISMVLDHVSRIVLTNGIMTVTHNFFRKLTTA